MNPESIPQQPVLTVNQEPVPILQEKKKSKPLFIILILMLLLVIGGIGGYYLAISNATKPTERTCTKEAKVRPDGSTVGRTGPNCEFALCPTPPESPPQDPTADWKTYSNEKYGFSFKYPTRWSETRPQDGTSDGNILIGGQTKDDLLHLNVIRFTGSTNDLVKKYQGNRSLFSNVDWDELGIKKEQKNIGKLDVVWFEKNITAMAGKNEVDFKVTNIVFTNGNLGFLINTQVNNYDELNNILATFKFTDQTIDTSGWKTYKVEEIPLVFSYPKNWTIHKSTNPYLNIGLNPSTAPETGFVTIQISIDSAQDNQGNRLHFDTIDEAKNHFVKSLSFVNPAVKDNIKVGDKKALSIEGVLGGAGPGYGMFLHYTFVQLNKKVLVIQLGDRNSMSEFYQILNAFNFGQ